jgi:hypothetical protein
MNTRIRKRNQRHTKVNRGSKRMRRRTNKRRTNKRRTNKRKTIRGGMKQPLTRHEQLLRQQPRWQPNSTESMKEQERRLKKMMDDAKAAKAAEKQWKKMMDDAKAAEAAEKEWKKKKGEEAARQSREDDLLAQQKARLILAEEYKRKERDARREKYRLSPLP